MVRIADGIAGKGNGDVGGGARSEAGNGNGLGIIAAAALVVDNKAGILPRMGALIGDMEGDILAGVHIENPLSIDVVLPI